MSIRVSIDDDGQAVYRTDANGAPHGTHAQLYCAIEKEETSALAPPNPDEVPGPEWEEAEWRQTAMSIIVKTRRHWARLANAISTVVPLHTEFEEGLLVRLVPATSSIPAHRRVTLAWEAIEAERRRMLDAMLDAMRDAVRLAIEAERRRMLDALEKTVSIEEFKKAMLAADTVDRPGDES